MCIMCYQSPPKLSYGPIKMKLASLLLQFLVRINNELCMKMFLVHNIKLATQRVNHKRKPSILTNLQAVAAIPAVVVAADNI